MECLVYYALLCKFTDGRAVVAPQHAEHNDTLLSSIINHFALRTGQCHPWHESAREFAVCGAPSG